MSVQKVIGETGGGRSKRPQKLLIPAVMKKLRLGALGGVVCSFIPVSIARMLQQKWAWCDPMIAIRKSFSFGGLDMHSAKNNKVASRTGFKKEPRARGPCLIYLIIDALHIYAAAGATA